MEKVTEASFLYDGLSADEMVECMEDLLKFYESFNRINLDELDFDARHRYND